MDIEKEAKDAPPQETAPVKEEPQVHTLLLQLKDTLTYLDKVITNKETRTIGRITKNVRRYRNVIAPHHIVALFDAASFPYPSSIKQSANFKADFSEKVQLNKNLVGRIQKTLELESFVRILLIEVLWREENWDECMREVEDLLGKITNANRRNLDNYSAFLYHFYARIHEKLGTELKIREELLEALNRACVRLDEVGQCGLLNLLLRNYLRHNHIEAAFNLIEKCTFPEGKSSNEFCKYLFYTGRVKAVRRQYGESLDMLNQAIRKSPDRAKGFKIQCQKVAIVVELLLGQVPNRQIFADESIFKNTYPYYRLIQAVLEGQLAGFHKIVQEYRAVYQQDKLYTIIQRLNQIVIRIGLRKISVAYSKISLVDIAKKLNIPAEDVEFVVAKALRDGIMHGQINHETQVLKIEADQNIYVTNEPQGQLDKRIRYCLGLYHQVQKAITYPDMKVNVEEFKEEELDASELLNLLEFDDEM